ncbi:phosphoheptose isomerase [Prescottella equi]|uniref:D-sedoheptulose-7-phosphate isomerase n=1 Tax=Rhodococcus hoagii TaxID=43767 RepID=UPI000A1082A1|nr:SIS domain-containing protein [Prescottella equi]ORL92664.1 phosphoheptose isomerase [Prescottella equi]ORM20900.1 phosphoheptose isomerase [Prescottella equi]
MPDHLDDHAAQLHAALDGVVAATPRLERWGRHLAAVLPSGARLLTCGNGGSAAEAQHLTGELVGRFEGERMPLSAIALHAETSSATAIANDYGLDEIFARQVRAHARAGDVLLCLSTSGRSPNVLTAAKAAHELGVTTWSMTGREPNPLAAVVDEAIAVDAPRVSTVQEIHLVLVHALCAEIDTALRFEQ